MLQRCQATQVLPILEDSQEHLEELILVHNLELNILEHLELNILVHNLEHQEAILGQYLEPLEHLEEDILGHHQEHLEEGILGYHQEHLEVNMMGHLERCPAIQEQATQAPLPLGHLEAATQVQGVHLVAMEHLRPATLEEHLLLATQGPQEPPLLAIQVLQVHLLRATQEQELQGAATQEQEYLEATPKARGDTQELPLLWIHRCSSGSRPWTRTTRGKSTLRNSARPWLTGTALCSARKPAR